MQNGKKNVYIESKPQIKKNKNDDDDDNNMMKVKGMPVYTKTQGSLTKECAAFNFYINVQTFVIKHKREKKDTRILRDFFACRCVLRPK